MNIKYTESEDADPDERDADFCDWVLRILKDEK